VSRGDGHPYDALGPDVVLGALESVGFPTDGRLLALNSFENRVYQCGLEDGTFVVAKFYRPGRWTDAAIGEEHDFTAELAAAELPVVAPLARDGTTLFRHAGFRFAVFPRRGGRAPELEGGDTLEWLGRTIARMHAVGERRRFAHRARIDVDALVRTSARHVLASPLLPPPTSSRYAQAVEALALRLDAAWEAAAPRAIRLHGDCHPGNLLWTDAGPLLLDLDDARSGPALQELAGPLRLMRQVHYAGWLAQRWDDPAFPRAFPFAAESRWWDEHVSDLYEALDADG